MQVFKMKSVSFSSRPFVPREDADVSAGGDGMGEADPNRPDDSLWDEDASEGREGEAPQADAERHFGF